jgi:hypothetical protein
MPKPFQVAGVILILGLSLLAQSDEPVPAPGDVTLHFSTDGDQDQFHLGELIPIEYSYSAEISGKYFLVSQSTKLEGGRGLEISCSPEVQLVRPSLPLPEGTTFEAMLNSCGGVGGGFGGACEDCNSEFPLNPAAIRFGPIPLNMYVRIRTPGTYTCTASSAEVTMAPADEKVRPALLVKSKPVPLTIVDEPAWSHLADIAYSGIYDKLCRGDDVAQDRFLQCSNIAQRITYLDTPESLATEVSFFDGGNQGWDNGFWGAIQHTSYPNDALRLMTKRIQDPDVQVSMAILESLASWDPKIDSPDAFRAATPTTYHSAAVEKLRKYVRLLGSSLSGKRPEVLKESAKTYRMYSEQKYCEAQPLISLEEQHQVMAALPNQP